MKNNGTCIDIDECSKGRFYQIKKYYIIFNIIYGVYYTPGVPFLTVREIHAKNGTASKKTQR